MALFDRFRKKKDDFMNFPAGMPGAGYGPAGFPPMGQQQGGPGAGFPDMGSSIPQDAQMQQYPQQPMAQPMGQDIENLRRGVETLNYKLDSIKAALDAINTRLANIESALRTTPGFEAKQGEGWT
ncbi:MAG: hypothetical protein V1839_01815 [archaeon]